jgi:hypothetical protein
MKSSNINQSGAIVCSEVANDSMPILYAERSEPEDQADSGWQFLCGISSENWRNAQVWAIHEVLEREPSITPFIELPSGTVLSRKSPADEWRINVTREANAPIEEGQLLHFATRYGLNLPRPYQDFIMRNNGGRPVPAAFPIVGFENNPSGVIHAFFGLNASIETEDLNVIMAELTGCIPSGMLPIACTEGDDFLCMDLRKPRGPIVFWDRKPFWGSNVWRDGDLYSVADDFDDLLVKLHDS